VSTPHPSTNISDPTLSSIDPASPDAPVKNGADAAGGGGGVFRLDSLAPGATEFGDAGSSGRKRKFSTQTLALTFLLAAGGATVYGMRMIGIGPMAALARGKMTEFESAVTPATRGADHKRVIEDLTTSHVNSQVPADQVQKNPFRMAEALSADVKPSDNGAAKAGADRVRRDAEARRKKIETTIATLKVHGILAGSNPVARISGQTVRVGDTVEEVFTVKAIHGRAVDLEADGEVFTLSIDDDQSKQPNGVHKK
jgi:hypothetical protein